jgi:N-acyl homoserine lactone hydrolase
MSASVPGFPSATAGATAVRRLFVLLCGFEILPKSISTRDRGRRFILSEPVCAYLLDTTTGWVLLDAGLNPANGRDATRMQERFWRHGMTAPVIRDMHLLERQLAELGVRFADIGHVILSHLHYDHCGDLRHFTHARISVQRREYDHAFGAQAGMAYFRDEYDDPRLQWDLRDGDWEAMPGLCLLDAADLQENLTEEIIPGECCDDGAALQAIQRLKATAQEFNATTLLFHDPVAIQSMRLAPEGYG